MRSALTSLFLFATSNLFALSYGPNFATSCTNDSNFGSNPWNNVGNACAEDGAVASESGISQYIKAVGLGFALPANAIITGIQVDVKKQATAGQQVVDSSVRLYINGTIMGSDKADSFTNWTTSGLAYTTYGGPGDTWGLSGLTGNDINNANFGLGFACQKNAGGTQTGNVDAIRITVFGLVQTQIINGIIKNGTLR